MFDFKAIGKYGKGLIIKMILQFIPHELKGKRAILGDIKSKFLLVLLLIVVAGVTLALIVCIVFVKVIKALAGGAPLYLLGGMLAGFIQ